MRKEYYTTIKSLLEEVTDLRHVGRWKAQTNVPDTINALPAAFIEFPVIDYQSMTRLKQSADNINFVVHLVNYKYTTEDTEDGLMFDLSQEIYAKLQRQYNIERLREVIDNGNDQLEDWQLTYVINRIEDNDAQTATTIISKPNLDADASF